ncbi:MAG TPA: TIGR01906 family membrane protein [Aggregatilineales bacterium]|nr:TIGR01906 family membrane protein [Aggregatilineales bacterium]
MDTEPTVTGAPAGRGLSLPRWVVAICRVVIVGALPLVLVLLNARVLMSDAYLRWEYGRASFPADTYGFSQAERLQHARRALAYLFNDEDIDYLGDQTFPDGSPLYNERELSHMVDVKVVTRQIQFFGIGLILLYAVCALLLALSPPWRGSLARSLFAGSVLTIALIVAGLIAVATSFDWLFTQFHALFFEGDSWLFLNSDTLIRLFPIQFWIDAFALMFGGALVEALIIGAAAWLVERRNR